jgi:hypothetical protein
MSEGITITPLAYSPKDAAKYLGISLRSLWRIIADRKVTVRKLGHRTMIDAASLRAYYASLPTVEAHHERDRDDWSRQELEGYAGQ